MASVHRHGDARTCGATTIVSTNSTVFCNDKLISVHGNVNTHGAGALTAGSSHMYCHSTLVVNNTPDGAVADSLCPSAGGAHCAPVTAAGSPNVFVGD